MAKSSSREMAQSALSCTIFLRRSRMPAIDAFLQKKTSKSL
jgi:hypothetical protein